MSNAEHYFENLLYKYARSEKEKESLSRIIDSPDANKDYLTTEQKETIEMCFVYLAFMKRPKQLLRFLENDYLEEEDENEDQS